MIAEKRLKRLFYLAAAAALVVFMSGCGFPRIRGGIDSFGNFGGEYRENIDRELPAEGLAKINISGINGSIKVSFDDGKVVRVHAVKVVKAMTDAKAKYAASEVEVVIEPKGDTLEIVVKHLSHFPSRSFAKVDFEITAPKGTWIGAETTNGPITLSPGAGGANLETTNGSVTAEGVAAGSVKIETTNGSVNVSDTAVSVKAETTNGSVTAAGCTGETRVETTNGKIKYTTSAPPDGDISLEVINGSIEAAVPDDAELDIDASTVNGSVKSDLALTGGTQKRKSVSGVLNKPTHTMRLESVNGSIRLKKAE